MKPKHLLRSRTLAIAGGLTVVALAAGGVAYATTVTAPSSAPASATATAAKSATAGELIGRPWLRLIRHTVHAQLIVRTKHGYETVTIDRGTLETVSTTSITIKRPDGPVVSAAISTSTRFRGLAESRLGTGDRVLLVQTGGTAVLIGALPPKTSATVSSSAGP